MIVIECKQYDWDYWCAHKGYAGASDASGVITAAKGDYPAAAQTLINKLIADRFNPTYGMFEETASAAMRNGLLREPEARRFAEFELDKEIREVGLIFDDAHQFCASPDGLIDQDCGIELKVPNAATHVGYLRGGVLPAEYRAQVHWSMVVTGFARWWCMSWSPFLPPLLVDVHRDEFTTKLQANMDRFWDEYSEVWANLEAQMPEPPPPKIIHAAGFAPVEVPTYVSAF